MASFMTETRRIIGHTVMRNEMNRYLPVYWRRLREITGTIVVYDDQSDDLTREWLALRGTRVTRRPDDVPSFAQDESACRQAGWRDMEQIAQPTTDDWILCLDADEIVTTTADEADIRAVINDEIDRAVEHGYSSVTFPVHEVFDWDDGNPLVRVDGYWGQITACRLVRWHDHGAFAPRKEGGGSLPAAWGANTLRARRAAIAHFGYQTAEDRQIRYERYRNGTGHNQTHIDSILQPPVLVPCPVELFRTNP